MEKKFFKLNDIESYRNSFNLSNRIWDIVVTWDNLAKDTIGKQFIRAADSISANIAEGFGRHGKKDKIRFYIYAKASVFESLDWNEKAKKRQLLSEENYDIIFKQLSNLPKQINILIKYTQKMLFE